MIKRLKDCKDELDRLYVQGHKRGVSVGWHYQDFPLTIQLGTTIYGAGAPASGKTEWIFEILINLSILHGWKHAIFSPETGEAHEIYAELMHKLAKKRFVPKQNEEQMSDEERAGAELFIQEHFFVVEQEGGKDETNVTLESFFNDVRELEMHIGKIHTTLIDPWNELKEEFIPDDLGREDKYLSRALGMVRRNAKNNMRVNIVLTHVRDQQMTQKDNVHYFPMPTAREFAGGQVWFRKGLTMLIFWRPPFGLLDENGYPYAENELHVRIAKSKPKGTSKLGTYSFYLDTATYRYYLGDSDKSKGRYADGKQEMEPPVQMSMSNVFRREMSSFLNDDFNDDLPF